MERPALVARLAVYAAALFVVITAQLPAPAAQSTIAALRTTQQETVDPVRLLLVGILLIGILIEVLRRRTVWH
jgi:hypothetical protein